jgi:hypothetical protein|tara:strand:- start:830 stop:1228 length:399 start_codon:yes stop_codon:yes gene_type:complete
LSKKPKTPLSINYDTIRLEEEQSLEIEAKEVEINKELSKVEISLLPSLHSMMSSGYSIIDEELHRLKGKAKTRGLDALDGKNFALLTNSLVKLANLEMNIREQSELETLDDEKIHTLAAEVLAKQIGGKGGR